MKNLTELCTPVCQIAEEKYQDFCSTMSMKISAEPGLNIFRDKSIREYLTQLCETIFMDEIANILLRLNDSNMGIVALDIPEAPHLTEQDNAVYGIAIVMGIFYGFQTYCGMKVRNFGSVWKRLICRLK